MPFGLDLKSVIVGILFAWFLLPAVMGMIAGGRRAPAKATV